tara:strand:+ start:4852 stop:4986 length:135 start_codon:yes stop_codon:yes gene_type:complete
LDAESSTFAQKVFILWLDLNEAAEAKEGLWRDGNKLVLGRCPLR